MNSPGLDPADFKVCAYTCEADEAKVGGLLQPLSAFDFDVDVRVASVEENPNAPRLNELESEESEESEES
jgi:hypothetical protein